MEKLLKALELLKQQALATENLALTSMLPAITCLLEDGIHDVAILLVNPDTQEVSEAGIKIIQDMSLEGLEKFRDFVGGKIPPLLIVPEGKEQELRDAIDADIKQGITERIMLYSEGQEATIIPSPVIAAIEERILPTNDTTASHSTNI